METEYLYLNGRRANPNYTVGTITLEDGITSIADNQFESCDKLENIILPEGLTTIGVTMHLTVATA